MSNTSQMAAEPQQVEAIMVEYNPPIELSDNPAWCIGMLFVDMQPAWCLYEQSLEVATGKKTYMAKEVTPFKNGRVADGAKLRTLPDLENPERAMQSVEAIFQMENAGNVTQRKGL